MIPGLGLRARPGAPAAAASGATASGRSRPGSSLRTPTPSRSRCGQRETQVERARIEQLDSQQRRLLQQHEREETEHRARAVAAAVALETLAEQAALAREPARRRRRNCPSCSPIDGGPRAEREQTQALNALRERWQQALGRQVSTEALQQAALGKVSGKVTQWLKSHSLDPIRGSLSSCAWSAAGRGRWRRYSAPTSRRCAWMVWMRWPMSWEPSTADIWPWSAPARSRRTGRLRTRIPRPAPEVSRPRCRAAPTCTRYRSVFTAETLAERCRCDAGSVRAIGGDARRHLAGRGLVAAVAGPGTAHRSDRAGGVVARPSRRSEPARSPRSRMASASSMRAASGFANTKIGATGCRAR